MDLLPTHQSLGERMALVWDRGVRIVTRLAIAFGLSTFASILVGAAVTDNGFVQIAITVLGAFGFWLPFFALITFVERLLKRGARRRDSSPSTLRSDDPTAASFARLIAAAPRHRQRLAGMMNSIGRSRSALGSADLDPDAHDLCLLIDRRLPELIDSELDTLAPDDRTRNRQLGELVDLIEQFARHCAERRSGDSASAHDAAVLRRRFEARLSDNSAF